jgi:hypothetical protein
MSLISYTHDQDSVILRVKILDSSVSTGAGKTGLLFSSAGLIIGTIADKEATTTAYTQAGSTIETIVALGTYSPPAATKCRFKEIDGTNHLGVYEIHLADARFAVASAKSLLVSISGAANAAECDVLIPLTQTDPYDNVRGGITALPNAAADDAFGLPISDAGGLDLDNMVANELNVTTYAEPSSVPAATASIRAMVHWLFTLSRNKGTQISTTKTLRNDADGADIGTSPMSSDGTTFTRGKWS